MTHRTRACGELGTSIAGSAKRRASALALGTWFALSAATAYAESEPQNSTIDSARVRLADVMASCPPSACEADLGPAPPPGSSRLITRAAILSALSAAGEKPGPHAQVSPVRVTSAARSLSAQELGQLVRPVVERCVPASATLSGVEPKSGVVLPLSATAQSCSLAPLPKRAGPVASTALVDFVHDGVLVRRVPVLVRLVLSAEAARPDVPKGHVVTLVIERRTATVSTQGIALSDAEVGELAAFKVQRTGRVVNARVQSSGLARVVDAQ